MAENTTVVPTTAEQLAAQEEAQLKALRDAVEIERQRRLQAARGQAISRGLSGSSFEQRSISEVNRVLDQALQEGETSIRGQFLNIRFQSEEAERVRVWQALEQEKQNAFASGEAEKARLAQEEQNRIQRESEEASARIEANSALIGNATQLAGLALLTKGGGAGAAGGAGGAASPGMFSTALNKAGTIFGAGSNAAPGAAGPALPTFTQGMRMPYAQGVAPGGAGAAGQAIGAAGSIYAGSALGQNMADSIFGQSYNNDRAVSRGGKAGSLAGATIGTYFGGPAGGAVGGAMGGIAGANAGQGLRMVANAGGGASDNKGITISNLAEGIARKPLQAIGATMFGGAGAKAANSVSKAAKKVFCFLPDTPVEMSGDRSEPIGTLRLGDKTLGGEVLSIRRSISEDLYHYGGIYVTGSHAVREDGRWIRVADSQAAEPVDGRFEVVSIVTTGHRIYSMGLTMADEVETEDYEDLSIEESLDALNREEEAKHGA